MELGGFARNRSLLMQATGIALLATAAGFLPWGRLAEALGRVPTAGWLAAAGAAVFLGGESLRRTRKAEPTSRHSWWLTVLVIVVPVVVLTVVAMVVMLSTLDTGDSAVRVDIVKTALSVGAGTGGLAALLLAGRRQWSTEHDSTERRITELYGKAADQLGSDKAAVRLAGLYSLERVGQGNPMLRQTVVSLICAYLRMPFRPPVDGAPRRLGTTRPVVTANRRARRVAEATSLVNALADTRLELQVRLTAQRILVEHLRPELNKRGKVTLPRFWADIELDLSGASLVEFDFTRCSARTATFDKARFSGETRLDEARFTGTASFENTRFSGHVRCTNARFSGDARFAGAQFKEMISFEDAQFGGDATFNDTRFSADASFMGAKFDSGAEFSGVEFTDNARFHTARFGGETSFDGTRFSDNVSFEWAQFGGNVSYHRTRFDGDSWFIGARFGDNSRFDETRFSGLADFAGARFIGNVTFLRGRFASNTTFDRAHFRSYATFTRVAFLGETGFDGANFSNTVEFYSTRFSTDTSYCGVRFGGGASFTGAEFTRNAHFVGAQFTGDTEFHGTRFYRGADFDKANINAPSAGYDKTPVVIIAERLPAGGDRDKRGKKATES